MRSMRTSGAWLAFSILLQVEAFEWHVDGRPEVNRKAIAGLWKLKPVVISRFPKEFTTSPRQPANEALPELLLMLKEDGSFHQYDQQTDVDSAWTSYQQKKKKGMDLTTGVWYVKLFECSTIPHTAKLSYHHSIGTFVTVDSFWQPIASPNAKELCSRALSWPRTNRV